MDNINQYVIGLDYGTDSVRAVLVNVFNGKRLASSIFEYPRWKQGLYCDASKYQFRQHPLDYVEGLEISIKECLKNASADVLRNILAISIDTTGSTPCAVNDEGVPLALLPEFQSDPDAMFVLWKDHTAQKEAKEINDQGHVSDTDYIKFSGGIYSSEWFWAKLLYVFRKNESVRKKCFTWVEHSDWIPFLLTGGKNALEIKRNVCAAGHKALWASAHDGFPPNDFFKSVDKLLDGHVTKINRNVYTASDSAGNLCKEWAERLGLHESVKIGIGVLDAHVGAVGGGIEPYIMSKVIGTSTCDMLVIPESDLQSKCIKGICGQVKGSIIPGMIGLEAGQSAFGDVFAWFKNILLWPLKNVNAGVAKDALDELSSKLLSALEVKAAQIDINFENELAVDWFNGRRSPDANMSLKGAIRNLSLSTEAPQIYRSLVEATCFGAKKIAERYADEGIVIRGAIGVGGIAKKSPFIMQMLADVLGIPIKVSSSDQACALGAAMFAATVAKIYPRVEDAMKAMGAGFELTYLPNAEKNKIYNVRYKQYTSFCNFT